MERFFVPFRAEKPHQTLLTVLRVILLALIFCAVLSGPSSLIIWGPAVTILMIATSLLVAHELLIRDVRTKWIGGSVALIIVLCSSGYVIWMFVRPPVPVGPLSPASDPMPLSSCHVPVGPHDLVMIMGPNWLVGKGTGPFNVLDVHDCSVLELRRVGGGGLMVDAYFYDWDNDIAFRVRQNVYKATTPLDLTSRRPDPHTLEILDRFGQEVLYLRFLNAHAVRVRGRFLCGEQPQVLVRDGMVLTGGVRINGVYSGLHRDQAQTCATVYAGKPGITLGGT